MAQGFSGLQMLAQSAQNFAQRRAEAERQEDWIRAQEEQQKKQQMFAEQMAQEERDWTDLREREALKRQQMAGEAGVEWLGGMMGEDSPFANLPWQFAGQAVGPAVGEQFTIRGEERSEQDLLEFNRGMAEGLAYMEAHGIDGAAQALVQAIESGRYSPHAIAGMAQSGGDLVRQMLDPMYEFRLRAAELGVELSEEQLSRLRRTPVSGGGSYSGGGRGSTGDDGFNEGDFSMWYDMNIGNIDFPPVITSASERERYARGLFYQILLSEGQPQGGEAGREQGLMADIPLGPEGGYVPLTDEQVGRFVDDFRTGEQGTWDEYAEYLSTTLKLTQADIDQIKAKLYEGLLPVGYTSTTFQSD